MVNLLFMDESDQVIRNDSGQNATSIYSLTGLIVPSETYEDLRRQYYQQLPVFPDEAENVVHLRPRELHAAELFKNVAGIPDEIRFAAFEGIVGLVAANRLRTYRVGYHRTTQVKRHFASDPRLLSLCWFGLLTMLQPEYASTPLMPIMDGFNKDNMQKLSETLRTATLMRAKGYEADVSLQNSGNIIGEVFFVDSQYSPFTQVVDMLAYLRNVVDRSDAGMPLTPFKQRLLEIANQLPAELLREEISVMRIDETQNDVPTTSDA